ETFPGYIVRVDRGQTPPQTCITEAHKVPAAGPDPRAIDSDTKGIVCTAPAPSSHLACFDRSKRNTLTRTETRAAPPCPAGSTHSQSDGRKHKNTDVPADFHYYNWVDQHNIGGLGADTPFATGSNSDALLALHPETGEWITMRVPYPLGFYQRGMDGRIDDPTLGWKGRAIYANYGTHLVWHIEGGLGTKGKLVKMQIRPDPLAH